jgi:hypothetical protein
VLGPAALEAELAQGVPLAVRRAVLQLLPSEARAAPCRMQAGAGGFGAALRPTTIDC